MEAKEIYQQAVRHFLKPVLPLWTIQASRKS